MVIDYLLYISHYLSVASLGDTGHMIHRVALRFEYSCWLRVQNEGYCKKPLEKIALVRHKLPAAKDMYLYPLDLYVYVSIADRTNADGSKLTN